MSHLDPESLTLIALGEQADGADEHLSGCALCRSEVDQFAAIVAIARQGEGAEAMMAPPPELWSRIAAAAGLAAEDEPVAHPVAGQPAGRQLAVHQQSGHRSAGHRAAGRRVAAGLPDRARPWWRRHPLAAAATAAAAGLIIGVGGAVSVRQLTAGSSSQVVATIALRPLTQFPQWQGASGTAVMRAGPAGRQLRVSLTAPQRPGFYEVWLLAQNGTSMISLGDLGPGHTGQFDMPPGVDLQKYSRIDVSLQSFDGSTLHAKTSVVRGAIP